VVAASGGVLSLAGVVRWSRHDIADERAVRWRLALVGCGQHDARRALALFNSV
jgi:hypothetical protein